MKILYIIDKPNMYGSEQHLLDIIKKFSQSQDISLIAFSKGEMLEHLPKIKLIDSIPEYKHYPIFVDDAMPKSHLEALALFPEPNIFLRAICLQLGFRVSTVLFDVKERQHGQTKYSFKKMLRLALHGITSFSVAPLRIVAIIGLVLFLFSLGMGGYVAWRTLFVGDTVPGWASTTLPIYFIGGVQLLCLGIVGEYVGQIYTTVKNRPRVC